MKEYKLLPCPFCGGDARLFERDEGEYDIACGGAGCYLIAGADWFYDYDDLDQFVAMWNTRPREKNSER